MVASQLRVQLVHLGNHNHRCFTLWTRHWSRYPVQCLHTCVATVEVAAVQEEDAVGGWGDALTTDDATI